jgi:hypothetical protein
MSKITKAALAAELDRVLPYERLVSFEALASFGTEYAPIVDSTVEDDERVGAWGEGVRVLVKGEWYGARSSDGGIVKVTFQPCYRNDDATLRPAAAPIVEVHTRDALHRMLSPTDSSDRPWSAPGRLMLQRLIRRNPDDAPPAPERVTYRLHSIERDGTEWTSTEAFEGTLRDVHQNVTAGYLGRTCRWATVEGTGHFLCGLGFNGKPLERSPLSASPSYVDLAGCPNPVSVHPPAVRIYNVHPALALATPRGLPGIRLVYASGSCVGWTEARPEQSINPSTENNAHV